MKSILFTVLATVFATTAALAENKFSLFKGNGPMNLSEDYVWVELGVLSFESGDFENTIEEQITKDDGFSLSAGWRPWSKEINSSDSKLVQILKNVGLSFDLEQMNGPNFNDYLYDRWVTDCYNDYYYGYYCVDREIPVYARDAYVKYIDQSVAIGVYLPVDVAQRLTVSAGLNLRALLVREGIQTDNLESSTETSTTVALKARLKLSPHVGVSVGGEKSIGGFKYKKASGGLVFTW